MGKKSKDDLSWYDQSMENALAGGDASLLRGKGEYSDYYLESVDRAGGSYRSTKEGKDFFQQLDKPSYERGFGPDSFREAQLGRDIANPYYQQVAREIGIKTLSSANDMGQVFKHLSGQRAQAPAPVAQAPAPAAPAPEAPKPPPFNLSDWTAADAAPSEDGEQGSGKSFLQRFMDDMRANAAPVYTSGGESTRPTLYDEYAADYKARSEDRVASFATDPTGQTPATGARTGDDDPARTDQGAGQFPQQTAMRQDSQTQDRIARTFSGAEPESTRFAGGRAFGEETEKRYGRLDSTYATFQSRYAG